ncbi:MAG: Secretion protein HlyD [Candidatus Doudnabacteria bacterium Gr01-1014_77]|uniref:Secretion protein HlyD n=1 Tax=Candidatus Doudnabacteria bacterium Gr01-1014_77 TaxID=2017133 RepID=A0A554JCF8_9BACT|nr:MAG: Secretion protein HlyD [Candidatus Doudnabacteria bacterium Gr01-1014_77]
MKEFIKRRKYWIIGGVILLALIIWRANSGNGPKYTVAYTVAKQDVKQTVLATGTITSQSNLNLSFKNGGILSKINVKVGDKVRKGQVLAMLDQRDASASLNQANAAVLSAQANYQKVKSGASQPEIAVAQASVDAAEVTYKNAQNTYTATQSQQKSLVASAQGAILNAGLQAVVESGSTTVSATVTGTYTGTEQGRYRVVLGTSGSGLRYNLSGIEGYYSEFQRGVPAKIGNKGLYITIGTTGTLNAGDSWIIDVPNTQSSTYITASNSYQSALQTQNQALVTAQNAVDSARVALTQAQANLNLKQSLARPEDLAAADAQVKTAQAQLQAAQNQYSNNIITSPIDGTVTSVDLKLGENVAPQKAVIVVLDQSSLHVESNISESSIALLQSGQKIDMTMDAFGPDRHFTGEVLSIDPASTVLSGVINYRVISSIPQDVDIKPGMTVNLVILVNEKTQVLAVPNRLVKSNSHRYVTVLENGNIKETEVTIGLSGDAYTEIISGLSGGEEIVTSIEPKK